MRTLRNSNISADDEAQPLSGAFVYMLVVGYDGALQSAGTIAVSFARYVVCDRQQDLL